MTQSKIKITIIMIYVIHQNKKTDLATAIQFLIMKQLLNDINAQTMKKFLS